MAEFSGKIVVVTGAGSGIGRSTARLFRRLGARVHVTDLGGPGAAGVVGLSEGLNAELGPKGIHVTALCPGIINTEIVQTSTYRGELADHATKVQEFYRERGASPDVVAEAAVQAVRKKKLIQPTPRSHVMPAWILKRISPRASQIFSRLAPRLVRR